MILITCDTLRADRLGAYGYVRDVSPQLDAFARESVVFDEAYASASRTIPALSSLFTGRLPDEIGATGNRKFIPAELLTLPELLTDHGIPSAAVVSNWALRRDHSGRNDVGVHQGFEHYDDRMTTRELNRDSFERWAPETTTAAIEWLDEGAPEGPFFLWVHYQNPHGPYTPPPEYAAQFDRPMGDEPPLRLGENVNGYGQLPSYQMLGDERRPDFYRNRYDAEIRFFDESLGVLLDALRERGLYEDSLIIFSSDHGESLGEHDYWFSHGENLHREVVRVPLIVRYPSGTPTPAYASERGRRTSRLAGHVDVLPTAAHALGVPWPKVRGLSLLTDAIEQDRVLAHTLRHEDSPHRWFGLSDGRHRLLIDAKRRPHLYDVLADPFEERDLAASNPNLVARLTRRYEEYVAGFGEVAVQGEDMEMDPETLEALRALGYVDPGAEAFEEE